MTLVSLRCFYSRFDVFIVSIAPWVFGMLFSVYAVPRVIWWFRVWKTLRPLPGPPDLLPFCFIIKTLSTGIWDRVSQKDITSWTFSTIRKLSSQYRGHTYKVYMGMTPIVVTATPSAAETLLTSSVNHRKPFIYDFINSWLGPQNVLVATGPAWRFKRKLMSPSFHSPRALEHYMRIFNENGDTLVRNICAMVDQSPDSPVRLFSTVQKCALDIIGEVTMGTNLHLQKNTNLKYKTSFNRILHLMTLRAVSPWIWIQFFYDRTGQGKLFKDDIREMKVVTNSVLQDRKYAKEKNEAAPGRNPQDDGINYSEDQTNLMNILLKQHFLNSRYTLDDVRMDIDTIMAAANDTTTTSICWTLSLLGRHPEVLTKVQNELDVIFGETKNPDVSADDLRRMQYLDCCVKESLRLYPSFPFVARVLDQELTLDGHRIPRGVMCAIDILSLHRNPASFDAPDEFVPERFTAGKNETLHPFSYIPFSGGAKKCLGQRFAMIEMKLLLAKVLCKCEVTPATPLEEVKIKYEVIIKASGGHPISIRRRAKCYSDDQ